MADFVTSDEIALLSGRTFDDDEVTRLEALIPLVCSALRYEAYKVDKDLDAMIEADETGTYEDVVKLVTTDVVIRVMRQSMDTEPMSQMSQGALGYTMSGTFAVPGGGIAAAIMRNDLKRLGLRRQRLGVIELYDYDD